jgi:hypothetical protein
MRSVPTDIAAELNASLAQSLARRFEATGAYKRTLDDRGNALLAVSERSGPASKAYLNLDERLETDERQLLGIKSAVGRPISRWGVRPRVLFIVGLGLAILEAPANKFLFDVALQSSGIVSYAVSAGVTAFLLFLAHFAGRAARQVWSDYRTKVIWSNIAVLILCLIVGATMIGVLTVARAAFATLGGSIGDLLSGIQSNIQDRGPFGALFAALGDTSALVLACINLGGVVTTFVLSFFSHDSDRDFDHAQNSVDRHEKAMERVHNAYLKERAKIIARYTPDLVGDAAVYNQANAKVIELKTRLGQPLEEVDQAVLTDLDQMAEDAERAEQSLAPSTHPGSSGTRTEPVVASMSDYRKPTGTEGA